MKPHFLVAIAAATLCTSALAGRSEQSRIDALLAGVENSGCRFERNGTQYSAVEGAAHLRAKLDVAGDRVQTAAQFIERIATASSQSARPYRVLCPGQPAQLSRPWLQQHLAELVAAGK